MSDSGSKRAGGLSIEKQALLVLQMKKKRAAEAAATPMATGIPRRSIPGPVALSFAQQRLWLLDRLDPGTTAYNIPFHARLRGPLDTAALAGAIAAIVRRHEALRTRFTEQDGEAVQVVEPPGDFRLAIVDLTALPEPARRRTEPELPVALLQPFDLARGPLFRAVLVRLAREEHLLFADVHHVVFDGWSYGIFFRELSALYGALRQGAEPPLPEPPIQYADFALWQRSRLQGAVLDEQLSYWRERLEGAPEALELPLDRTRPAQQGHRGGKVRSDLPAGLAARLRELSLREGASPFMTLLAALALLLSRLSGQDDVVVGSPSAGRNRREIEGLIGLFLNTLVLRTDLSGNPTFRDLLGRVKKGVLGAYQYQEIPFERLLEELQPERLLSRSPLFQVLFNYVSLGNLDLDLPGLEVEPIESAEPDSKFDFTLYAYELPDTLRFDLVYNTDLFEAERMRELLRQLEHLVQTAVTAPETRLDAFSLVTPAPLGSAARLPDPTRQLPGAWHGAVQEALTRGALDHLDRIAVEDASGAVWTYAELESHSNRLAHFLRGQEVRAGEVVAIWAHRAAPLVQAVMGTLKAGAAFLILDPAYPAPRLLDYLRIARPAAWVAVPGAPPPPAEVTVAAAELCRCRIELLPGALTSSPETAPKRAVGPDDPACITFTSGSTGNPKGVVGRHGALTHFYPWMAQRFALTGEDRFATLSALSHDPLQRDIFTPLWLGARIAMPDPARIGAPGYLATWLCRQAVTAVNLTPAMMELVLESATDGDEPVVALPDLRLAFVVGDLLKKGSVRRLQELSPALLCINLYGSTETQRALSYFVVPRGRDLDRLGKEVLPLGEGMEGCQLLVLSGTGQLAGVGEPGEIHIRSRHLAQGYLGDDALTAQRFLPNPLALHPAADDRAYRTGDLGRYLPDGGVELIGRADFQVKLRGFRIELGEVEAALARHPAVREAVVVIREDARGERRLAAYFVAAAAAPTPRELRDFLAARLPDYMVPSAIVPLPSLPLTPAGKVDRLALPTPAAEERQAELPYGRSPIEELLAGLWVELLGRTALAPQDNFFELGGHSLLATRMISRVRVLLGVELPLRSLFEEPTLAGFARLVELARRDWTGSTLPPLVRVPRGAPLPTSPAQQRLWFLQQLDPASFAYNLTGAVRLAGPLDLPALTGALEAIVWRHEALRTTFVDLEGEPWQAVAEPQPLPLPLVDLSGLPADRQEEEVRQGIATTARLPYDLSLGPLLRTALFQRAAGEHVLLVGMHHIVSDAWSMSLFVRELAAHYRALHLGEGHGLPELAVQYGDYAAWQRLWLSGEGLEQQLCWWTEQLAGAPPVLELPLDRPRATLPGFRGHRSLLSLDPALSAQVETIARRLGATPFMLLLAGFSTLLSRYSGQQDLVLGTPIANRGRAELEELIGFFVNTLALRIDLSGGPSFADLVRRIRERALGAYAHQDVPFERLVDELRIERSLSHAPLFQVSFALQNVPPSELELADLTLIPLDVDPGRTPFDLSLFVQPLPEGGLLTYLYASSALFDATTAHRLLAHYRTLLTALADGDVERTVSALPVLGPEESTQVVAEWNDTATAFPRAATIHSLFAEQARRAPQAIAVLAEGETLTYAELDRRSDRIASRLVAAGVRPDEAVGLCAERSPDLIAALLGILKAGGGYVPLDPDYPRERLTGMLADAGIRVLLSQDRYTDLLPETGVLRLSLDRAAREMAEPEVPAVSVDPASLAYVVFTSGSTGRPKGVAVGHRSVVRLVRDTSYCRFGADETFLQLAPVAFDASTFEIWGALLNGARVALFPPGPVDLRRLGDEIAARRVTTLFLTSGLFHQMVESNLEALRPLRQLLSGGDFLAPALVRRVVAELPATRFLHVYGPTEVTTYTTSLAVAADTEMGATVSIGAPIANTRAYILDRELQPAPIGVAGELHAAGEGLARGYVGRPDLTAERFIPSPVGGQAGERLYATGDLARWLANGRIELFGRRDHQVKIRGFRIELGEIEGALASLPEVEAAVVVARTDASGDKRLVAYVVPPPERAPDAATLRRRLESKLPAYMLPSTYVLLAALPLDANGKLDRKALPAPESGPRGEGREEARTPMEEIVAGLWSALLGVSGIGPRDNFFELGGHSLLATRWVSQVRAVLGVEVPLRAVFEEPTLAGCAALIERAREGGLGDEAPPLVRVPRGAPLPVSFSQQRLWFLQQLDAASVAYNLTGAARLTGSLHVAALEGALAALVGRHESLRTVFRAVGGEPWQVVAEPAALPLPLVDLSALAPAAREEETRRQAGDDARRPYDLERGPLLRAVLVRWAGDEHALILGMHHIVSDGWSMGILVRELGELYGALAERRAPRLAALPLQYADYASWQRLWLNDEVMAERLAWWTRRLSGAPQILALPLDRPRPAIQSQRGHRTSLALGPDLSSRLETTARRLGITAFMAYLAAFATLLARLGGQRDIVVGTPIANRERAELEGLIGFFVNTLALRLDLSGDPTFSALARQAREVALGAYAHQEVPFDRLVDELRVERSLTHSPVFQVVLALQNLPPSELELAGLTLSPLEFATGRTHFDLSLFLVPLPASGELVAQLDAAGEIFEPATTRRLLGHFRTLLAGICAGRDDASLSDLPLLSSTERTQLVAEWNDTATNFPREATLHALFAEQAGLRGEAPAVLGTGETLTYAELERRANRIAKHLVAAGVRPDEAVGLCAERSANLIAALLGILKAGGAYVPLDPDYPGERLAGMLADADIRVLLIQDGLESSLPESSARRLSLDRAAHEGDGAAPPLVAVDAVSLAYIVFTSGSTGRPKGVAVDHRSVVRLVRETNYCRFGPDETFLQIAPVAFDASTFEIWGALLNGGRLALFPPGPVDLHGLGRAIEAHRVTTLFLTSGLFHQMVESNLEGLRPLRQLLSGGDFLTPALVRRVAMELPTTTMLHVYGPTEVTTFTTFLAVTPKTAMAASVPIGAPIANTRVYVLGDLMQLAPIGVTGELYAAGEGLARGYAGRPDLTAERFLPSPVGGEPGERLYATGDLARWLPDGMIELLGRRDAQVKIRGFRIELGEIEGALTALPEVEAAVVVARGGTAGDKRLVAYVVPEQGVSLSSAVLRQLIEGKLPAYMIPSLFVPLAALPLDPNGKLDRKALPEPEVAGTEHEGVKSPLEEILGTIWSEILGVPRIGRQDGFFELGGHSLLATRMISRVRTVLGLEIPLRAVFEEPTLAGFAARVERERQGEGGALPPLVRVPRNGPLPTTFSQRRLWFLQQLDPESTAYNLTAGIRLAGPLRGEPLARALGTIVGRHEALRTVFAAPEGEPRQVIVERAHFHLPLIDLTGLPPEARGEVLLTIARAEAQRPYDLELGPLFRARLLRLATEEHALLVGMHHIVSDGWSLGILVRELGELYGALTSGREPRLATLPIQYGDYAAWQRERLSGGALEELLAWWTRQLAGAPQVTELPLDRPRRNVQGQRGHRAVLALGSEVSARLESTALRLTVTPFMLLLAGFGALLARYGGQSEVVLGTPIANRGRSEIEDLIGFFVNTLALRLDLTGDPRFDDLARRARELTLGAYAHQDVPFERLVEELRVERSLSHTPVFQASLALENLEESELELAGLTLSPLEIAASRAQFDLTMVLTPQPDGAGLLAKLHAASDLFDPTTTRRILGHFRCLIEAITAPGGEGIPVSELPLLTAPEVQQLRDWNDTASRRPADRGLHQLVEEQAARTPHSPAVRFDGGSLTYAELDRAAARLARQLGALGVGTERIVGVLAERSREMVVALLAVLKAGAAYLPLDPDYPAERLALMLDDAQVPVILAQESPRALLATTGTGSARILVLDLPSLLAEAATAGDADSPLPPVDPASAAYVIYTSGSTGRPKGTVVPHTAIVSHLRWMQAALPFYASDRVLQNTPFGFDAAGWEIWAPLLNGSVMILTGPGEHRDPEAILGRIREEGATVMQMVPSQLTALLESGGLGACRTLRRVCCGGEALSAALVQSFFQALDGVELYNFYGPTEATVECATWHIRRPLGSGPVPIGRPVGDTQIHITGREMQPQPAGAPGELLIGGAQVVRGYLDRPELTAERFIPDPFSALPGARLYRSGDLARRRAAGEIEFLGRIDHQVKIRGNRIELGEVEAALLRQPGVVSALAMVREDTPGDRRLVAYVVGDCPSASDLRLALKRELPDPMVPTAFVPLPAFPLSAHGKIDRKALPAPEGPLHSDAIAPRSPLEAEVARIWREVLKLDRLGVTDSFWDLGGHSLLATQVVSRVRRELGAGLSVRALFEHPTVEGLALHLAEARTATADSETTPLRPRRAEAGEPVQLSFAQQRLWFLDQMATGALYNMPAALRLTGRLDAVALSRALTEIVRRHDALRTRFALAGEEPVQLVFPLAEVAAPILPWIDLSELPLPARGVESLRWLESEAVRPFDLARGPLYRFRLLRRAPTEHDLLLNLHHIISDGWSIGVLLRELGILYAGLVAGALPRLPDLPVQYADFALWQRSRLQGELLEREVDFWRRRLGTTSPVLDLPTDRPRPAVQSFRGDVVRWMLPRALARRIDAAAREGRATPFIVLMAAFQALLGRWTTQPQVNVGTPIAGRTRVELEGLIGFFVNTLVIRTDLRGEPAFRALVDRVRETTLEAHAHQDLPFEKLVEALEPERSLSHSPLFQVMLTLQSSQLDFQLPELGIAPLSPHRGTAKFDLLIALGETEEGLEGGLEYASDLFDRTTAVRLLRQLETLLEGALTTPGASFADLPLLDPASRAHLLLEWNDTATPFPGETTIHALFEEQVRLRPHAVAVLGGEESLTYAELDRRASRIAAHLVIAGVRPDDTVGLCAERSPNLIAGLLGILKAGGAYVPLDPSYPRDRLAGMLADAAVRALLLQDGLESALPEGGSVRLSLEHAASAEGEGTGAPIAVHPSNLAYVIFTSGSTGRPKGVAISHRGVIRLVRETSYCSFGTKEVFLQLAPVAFDASTFELWGPLLNGGKLALFSPGPLDLSRLTREIQHRGVTTLLLTTGLFHQMVELHLEGLRPLRQLLVGGDFVSPLAAERVLSELPETRMIHVYGPTEVTTATTAATLSHGMRFAATIPIGRPIANTGTYVLDAGLQPAAIGTVGQLYAGGAGLARGYLGRPDLTAERFIPDAVSGESGGRLYATGDLARWLPDGRIELFGRRDAQVKIRGFRIELGEVETAVAALPAVENAVVLARADAAGDKRLVAYVVPQAGITLEPAEIRDALQSVLPAYMLPSAFVLLPALPLDPNGKVDRRALPEPTAAPKSAFTAPRTPLEEEVARLWREALNVERVGVDDSFWDLGGHSLLATRVFARLTATFGIELPIQTLFRSPTLGELAVAVGEAVMAGLDADDRSDELD